MSLPAGTRVGSYEILGLLGAGGMGQVYRALDRKLERHVALKFLSGSLSGPEEKERFLREARAASALDHPNIGTIYTIEDSRALRVANPVAMVLPLIKPEIGVDERVSVIESPGDLLRARD